MTRSRGRPPKERAPLDVPRIVAAALALADEGGLEALTIRGVAEALSVSPMAVYNHVHDKQALIAAIFDHVMLTYAPADHETADIEGWLFVTFERVHRAFCEHRALVPLLSTWFAMGPDVVSMTLLDRCLERLSQAGFDDDSAVAAFYELLALTMGRATIEAAVHIQLGGLSAEALRRYALTMEAVALGSHPAVARLAPALATAFAPTRFEASLRHAIASLRRRREADLDQIDSASS